MPDESASEVRNPPDRALRDGLALAFAVGLVGIVFGVLARSSGLSVAKACAMSLLVFTGASQIAAASVIGAGGTQYAALGSALLLAARNALYGPVVAPWFRESSTLTRVGLGHRLGAEAPVLGGGHAHGARRQAHLVVDELAQRASHGAVSLRLCGRMLSGPRGARARRVRYILRMAVTV